MHPILSIADALAEWLKGQSLSLPATIARRNVVELDLKTLSTIQISVVPADWNSEILTRTADRLSFQVDIAVQQKLDTSDQAAVDALMDMVWEIETQVKRVRLATTPPAQWTKVEKVAGSEPGFAREHLSEKYRTFTSVRRHTFVQRV